MGIFIQLKVQLHGILKVFSIVSVNIQDPLEKVHFQIFLEDLNAIFN